MAKKTFALNTDPHVATVGDTDLLFKPEVMGDEFMDYYGALKETYAELGIDESDMSDLSTEQLKKSEAAVRTFVSSTMLEESVKIFSTMRLPTRVLLQLLDWVMEVYGDGRPPTSPSGSSKASAPPGTPSMATSRSTGPTRTRGR